MTHPNVFRKLSLSVFALLAIFLLTPVEGAAQSTNPDAPTPVTSYPITGRLASGTYYYLVSESLVTPGPATAGLSFTPPAGGGSMTASFSGPRCCTGEPTVGDSTGYEGTVRRFSTFTIADRQSLLVTLYVSVAAKQTIEFHLTVSPVSGSGVIITPPSERKTEPTPPLPPPVLCTDLSVTSFQVVGPIGTRRRISGAVRNLTTTHPYKSFPRLQGVEVFDITDSAKDPRRVGAVVIPDIIDPGASVPYSIADPVTHDGRRRYKVQIYYHPSLPRDRSQYNDDCNRANNSTMREMIGGVPLDVESIP